jgi:hypothetical protein
MKYIKTWVRISMTNDKLNSLSVAEIESEHTQALSFVINVFAVAHPNVFTYIVDSDKNLRRLIVVPVRFFFNSLHLYVYVCVH